MQSQDQSKDPGQFRRIQAQKQQRASSKPQAWQVKNANQPNFQAAGRWDKGVPILDLKYDPAIHDKVQKKENITNIEDPGIQEHLIREGDSLYGITAQYFPNLIGNHEHFNAKMQEIADLNGLGGITGTLLPGQKLKIPMKIQPSPNLNAHEYAQHHVQAGEGFWVITEKYFPDLLRTQGIEAFKAKMQEIAEFNGLLYYYSNIDPSKFSGKPLLIPLKTKPVEPTLKEKWTLTEEDKQEMLIHPSDRARESYYSADDEKLLIENRLKPSYPWGKPIKAIDLSKSSKAWFVHGTWQKPKYFQQSLIDRTVKTFGSTEYTRFKWDPKNTAIHRVEGARKLVNEIMATYVKGELIVIMTHSHGGNLAKWAINYLVFDHKIDPADIVLITINLPVKSRHQAAEGIYHFNIRSKQFDIVSFFGAIDQDEYGLPEYIDWNTFRDDPDATINIVYEDQYPTEYLKTSFTPDGKPIEAIEMPKFYNDAFANHNGPWKKNVDQWFPKLEMHIELLSLKSQYQKLYEDIHRINNQINKLSKEATQSNNPQPILNGLKNLIDFRDSLLEQAYTAQTQIQNIETQLKN